MNGWGGLLACIQLVGWMLLHSLWQGALLGALYGVLRSLLPRGAARYRLGMACLIGLALCPLFTLWRLTAVVPQTGQSGLTAGLLVVNQSTQVVVTNPATGALATVLNSLLPWLVLFWVLGVVLLSLRTWRQWRELRLVVRMAEAIPFWQLQIDTLAERVGLRRKVAVLCSNVIASPMLIGWIRPVILLPVAVASNFPACQVELILAHELAHLRRRDPLVNLFQVLVETILFYHPVVHWISREVRNEREICCDSLALSVSGGSRREFVQALAELGELRERHASMVLAANGGVLFDRVQQMLLADRESVQQARMPVGPMALLFIALVMAFTLQVQLRRDAWQEGIAAAVKLPQWKLQLPRLSLEPNERTSFARDLTIAVAELPRTPVMRKSPSLDGAGLHVDDLIGAVAVAMPRFSPLPNQSLAPVHIADSELISSTPSAPAATASLGVVPTPIQIRQPVYPRAALARGIEGSVVIEFGLTAHGGVSNPRVVAAQPSGEFEAAAIDAVRAWKFAAPPAGEGSRRYRQTLAFTISGNTHGLAQQTRGNGQSPGRNDCRVTTGTHICRESNETDIPAGLIVTRRDQH